MAWKPTFNQYIFPDKSNIRVSKTVSKSIGGTQEFIAVIYPYTDGTNSPTKDFVITFLNEKIVKMELQESRAIKIIFAAFSSIYANDRCLSYRQKKHLFPIRKKYIFLHFYIVV